VTEGEAGRWLVMGISLVSSPVHLPFHYRFISDRDYVIVSESSHGIVFSIVFNDTNAAGKLRSFTCARSCKFIGHVRMVCLHERLLIQLAGSCVQDGHR
jgi:hypothetical protein